MKAIKFVLFMMFLLPAWLFAQNSDQTNNTDNKGRKQGYWIEQEGSNYIHKGKYIDDVKDGSWTVYNVSDSSLFKVETYKMGLKDGIFLEFSRRSMIASEQYFTNDLPDGVHRVFSNSGLPFSVNNYSNGLLNGKQISYYENTQNKISELANYKNGVKDGLSRWYDLEGNLIAEYSYKNGLLEGEQKSFFPNGKPRSSDMFVNNLYQGPAVEYFENGNIKLSGQYKDGEKDGKWMEYNESGKLIQTLVYVKGQLKK